MLPLAGYADRLSARPGETLRFHVSNTTGAPVSASIVRVISADANPAIGGVRTLPVSIAVRDLAAPKAEAVPLGSWASADLGDALSRAQSLTLTLRLMPTRKPNRRQTIAYNRSGAQGFAVALTAEMKLTATLSTASGDVTLTLDQPLIPDRWATVTLTADGAGGTATLSATKIGAHPVTATAREHLTAALRPGGGHLAFASASAIAPVETFNGRIENPAIYDRALPDDQIARHWKGERLPGLVAGWDFSRDIGTAHIIDTGPSARHGSLHNTPTRAMRGSTWNGREHCFRHAPEQYAAIHFHDDDLDDCRWPATHAIDIPADLKSGAYALILKAGDAEENIPFFTLPPKGKTTSKLAVLVSTYTYTVYGNHARPEWMTDEKWKAAWIAQSKDWKGYPYNPGEHRDYGLSTYNYHTDGSGIAIVTWKRPMLNLRIGYLTYPYPEIRASGLRHYPADSHLLAWLEHKGHDFDLITDFELHHEGCDLLRNYKCVVTGSHPEYHTPEMLDALEGYRDQGGKFVYLGGNGFYWKIALDPARDGIVEIRRAEGGIRAWAAEPGEYYNQFDAEYGGLWRRNARPPQKLVGVGFTAQGNFVGSHYRVDPAARANPKVAWILEGVEADTIGGEGFSGHGAAGFELDRADKRLGTPDAAIVIAASENHPPEAPWVLVPEEQLTHITTITGDTHKQLIRADMTYFEVPGGGAVFSTGSITFCGSLPVNNFENDISRVIDNVLRRFTA